MRLILKRNFYTVRSVHVLKHVISTCLVSNSLFSSMCRAGGAPPALGRWVTKCRTVVGVLEWGSRPGGRERGWCFHSDMKAMKRSEHRGVQWVTASICVCSSRARHSGTIHDVLSAPWCPALLNHTLKGSNPILFICTK